MVVKNHMPSDTLSLIVVGRSWCSFGPRFLGSVICFLSDHDPDSEMPI